MKELFTIADKKNVDKCKIDTFTKEQYMRYYEKTEKTETCECEDLEDSHISNTAGLDIDQCMQRCDNHRYHKYSTKTKPFTAKDKILVGRNLLCVD